MLSYIPILTDLPKPQPSQTAKFDQLLLSGVNFQHNFSKYLVLWVFYKRLSPIVK